MPVRGQRKREKSWRLPVVAKCVDRSTRWGNPYIVAWWNGERGYYVFTRCTTKPNFFAPPNEKWTKEQAMAEAVKLFRAYAEERLLTEPDWLDPLRGCDLYDWCRLDQPCHADVLLELANR